MKGIFSFSMAAVGIALLFSLNSAAIDNNNILENGQSLNHSIDYRYAYDCMMKSNLNREMANELALQYETFRKLGNSKESAMSKVMQSLIILTRRQENYDLCLKNGHSICYAEAFVDLLEEEEASYEEAEKYSLLYEKLMTLDYDKNEAWEIVCQRLEHDRINIEQFV